jgi:murein DD-endopeptidase MepM/ murein hydrolase activator NlpD
MKMAFIFSLLILSKSLFSQSARDLTFEHSKATLPFPISNFSSFISEESNNSESNDIGHKGIIFFSTNIDSVKAVFKGKVEITFPVGSGYAIIVNYGNYFITYFNLDSATVKPGDPILQGQWLGNLPPGNKQIKLVITTRNNKEYDPNEWFKWTKDEESRRKY